MSTTKGIANGILTNHSVSVASTFTDDHILCVNLNIDDNMVPLMWVGWELVAALTYMSESSSAKITARDGLARLIADRACDILDGEAPTDADRLFGLTTLSNNELNELIEH